jgi:hypothetical protein
MQASLDHHERLNVLGTWLAAPEFNPVEWVWRQVDESRPAWRRATGPNCAPTLWPVWRVFVTLPAHCGRRPGARRRLPMQDLAALFSGRRCARLAHPVGNVGLSHDCMCAVE